MASVLGETTEGTPGELETPPAEVPSDNPADVPAESPASPEVEPDGPAGPGDSPPETGAGEGGPADEDGSPEPEPEPTPEGAGKLLFRCQKCGEWNDLVREDAVAIEPPKSSRYETCGECEGVGRVDTGSYVPGQETRPCPECNGQGFLDKQTGQAPPAEAEHGEPPWPGAVFTEDRGWVTAGAE